MTTPTADTLDGTLANADVDVADYDQHPGGAYLAYHTDADTFRVGTVARAYIQHVERIDGPLVVEVFDPGTYIPDPEEIPADEVGPVPTVSYAIRPEWARDYKGDQLSLRGLANRMLDIDTEDVDAMYREVLGETGGGIAFEFSERVEENGLLVLGIDRESATEPFDLSLQLTEEALDHAPPEANDLAPVLVAFYNLLFPYMETFARDAFGDLAIDLYAPDGKFVDSFAVPRDETWSFYETPTTDDGQRLLMSVIDSADTVDLTALQALDALAEIQDSDGPDAGGVFGGTPAGGRS